MYAFEPSESISGAIPRVAREQLDSSLEWLGGADRPLDRRVHEARKSIKRLRALLALADGSLDVALQRAILGHARAAAQTLARLRDTDALLESLQQFVSRPNHAVSSERLRALQSALSTSTPDADVDVDALLATSRQQLEQARTYAQQLRVEVEGWSALELGFGSTYAAARRGLGRAAKARGVEAFHAFRTPTKRHFYQIQLLQRSWPGPLGALQEELDELGERLGEHHDLCLLQALLRPVADSDVELRELLGAMRRHVTHLEADALTLGGKCFAERRKQIVRRFRAYFGSR